MEKQNYIHSWVFTFLINGILGITHVWIYSFPFLDILFHNHVQMVLSIHGSDFSNYVYCNTIHMDKWFYSFMEMICPFMYIVIPFMDKWFYSTVDIIFPFIGYEITHSWLNGFTK